MTDHLSQSAARTAPRFSAKVTRSFTRTWKGWIPIQGYYGSDGDYTNEHIWFGVEWMERGYGDNLASIGVDLVIPPKLFWLIKLLRLPHGY